MTTHVLEVPWVPEVFEVPRADRQASPQVITVVKNELQRQSRGGGGLAATGS